MDIRLLKKAAALACVAVLLGCASAVNPITGKSINTPISATREAYYGAEANKDMLASYGAYTDNAALSAYVDRVGQTVAKGAVRKSVKYTFTILDSEDVNAYALPGGYVYITRGALSFANSEAELAAILGHEIGHIDAFHFHEKRHDTMKALLSILLKNSSSSPSETQMAEKLATASADSSAYSQDQEYEADALGIHYMAAAGYDPQAMVTMMRTDDAKSHLDDDDLKGNAVAHEIMRLNQSHPPTPDRLARAGERAKVTAVTPAGVATAAVNPGSLNPAEAGGPADRDAFLAAIDGMTFGEDPADGVIEGRQLIRPALGFSFKAPEGFDLWNLHASVIGLNTRAVMLLEMDKTGAAGLMTDYVAHTMVTDGSIQNLRSVDVEGMEAATGVSRTPLFTMRVAAIRDPARHIFILAFMTPTKVFAELDKGFVAAIESFRHAATIEAPAAPKLRVHVVTVGAGDTVESLAAQMAVKEKKVEWFRVLNGLSATDAIEQGQRVKMVAAE